MQGALKLDVDAQLECAGVARQGYLHDDGSDARAASSGRCEVMVFTKRLREGVRRGRIRCSVRIWKSPHVKAGGHYPMDDGQIVVDSIVPITLGDITYDLARESGFDSVEDLLQTAKHGSGNNVYLIRFHYLPPGAWDAPIWKKRGRSSQ
jgi:hypothetical protein